MALHSIDGNIKNSLDKRVPTSAGTIAGEQIIQNTITGGTTGNLALLTVAAGNIVAGTITANKITISTLSALTADMGTITAGTITGAIIQTASSGRRVKMDTDGIILYNSSGNAAGYINNASGVAGLGAGASMDSLMLAGDGDSANYALHLTDGNVLTTSIDSRFTISRPGEPPGTAIEVEYADDLQGTPTYTTVFKINSDKSINTDKLVELTGANGIEIDGLSIKDGKLNTSVCVVGDNLGKVIGSSAYLYANQNISNAAPAGIVINTEQWDPASIHNASTGIVTIGRVGIYRVTGKINWAAHGSGQRIIMIYKNGSQYDSNSQDTVGAGTCTQTISLEINLSDNDTIQLVGYQNSGVVLAALGDIDGIGDSCRLQVRLVGTV